MTGFVGFCIAGLILAAIAVFYYAMSRNAMRDERDWALLELTRAQGRLHQYRETERTRKAHLREWGRKGALTTNAKRVTK